MTERKCYRAPWEPTTENIQALFREVDEMLALPLFAQDARMKGSSDIDSLFDMDDLLERTSFDDADEDSDTGMPDHGGGDGDDVDASFLDSYTGMPEHGGGECDDVDAIFLEKDGASSVGPRAPWKRSFGEFDWVHGRGGDGLGEEGVAALSDPYGRGSFVEEPPLVMPPSKRARR